MVHPSWLSPCECRVQQNLSKVSARNVCDFSEPPPNLDPVKVKQTSAESKIKNAKMWYTPLGSRPASAECSQTYLKLSKREQRAK